MFEGLSKKLSKIFDGLRGKGVLTPESVEQALREIRVALLEADVALDVVKSFIDSVRPQAIGQEVLRSITPGQMVVKIVHDHLVDLLGSELSPLNLKAVPPVVMMVVGLQGSGKTTTTAKVAKYLTEKERKKVLMASLDIYRPAAQHQLEVLGTQNALSTVPIVEGRSVKDIAREALDKARKEGFEVLLLDTAGRLHVDEPLMEELKTVKTLTSPVEILLVADALTGQDAVKIAQTFHDRLGLTGIALTRLDGDARGGAALSMKTVTGCPIKFVGTGERVDQLELFHPERMAGRILDMGDVVSLVEKAMEAVDEAEAQKLVKRLESGHFNLNDMRRQLQQISKMGGASALLKFLPGTAGLEDRLSSLGISENFFKRQMVAIDSMTKKERRYPKLLNASRKIRVSKGSGIPVNEINALLKNHQKMEKAIKRMNKLGQKGLLRQGIGSLFS